MHWLSDRLREQRCCGASEAALSLVVSGVLALHAVPFLAEWPTAGTNRLDFYLPAWRTGVELKVKGSVYDVLRQLARYAEMPEVDRLLLVTTHARLGATPATLRGKPLDVAVLWSGAL